MDKPKVKIGNIEYISLCTNCKFGKKIKFIEAPKTNADVTHKFPGLDAYRCPETHTDLVYIAHGEGEVMMDVAECGTHKPEKK